MKNTEQPIKSQPFTEMEMMTVPVPLTLLDMARMNAYNTGIMDALEILENSIDLDSRQRILNLFKK
jgi:hypothetical protein